MTPTHTLNVCVHENQHTNNDTIFHCAVCDVDVASKSDWLLHVCGRIHSQETRNNRHDSNVIVDEIIQQIRNFLGEQNKFIVRRKSNENVFKFNCVLCDDELNSYFGIMEHVGQILHETRLKDYHWLKQSKKDVDVKSNTGSTEMRCNNPAGILDTLLPTSDSTNVPVSNQIKVIDRTSRSIDRADIRPLLAEDVINVISCLSNVYMGVLKCKICNETVSFNEREILDHDKRCKTSIVSHSNEKRNSSCMISKFEQFCVTSMGRKFDETDAILLQKVNSTMSTASSLKPKVNQLETYHTLKTTVKFFECLVCDFTSGISDWESHVICWHSTKVEDNPQITCLCLLCDKLLFGPKNTIVDHEHFKTDDVHRFSFIAPVQFTRLLRTNELPRYYTFILKFTKIEIPREVTYYHFFCSVCDFYGSKKVEKHFASAEHKFKANISNDLFICEACSIVFYGDGLLLKHHKLSPSHILSKHKALKHPVDVHTIVGVESVRHKSLMSQLRKKIDQKCESNDYQFNNNFQRFAYFCSPCEYVTSGKDEWLQHLRHDEHTKKIDITSTKLFEYGCVYCKLSIFGTIECQLKHTSSPGHELVKRLVTHRFNKQQLLGLLNTRGLSNSLPDLSDLLYETLPEKTVVPSVPRNESLVSRDHIRLNNDRVLDVCKEKKDLPEHVDSTNCNDGISLSFFKKDYVSLNNHLVVDDCKEKRALLEHIDTADGDDGTELLYFKKVGYQDISATISVLRSFLQSSLEKSSQPKCKSFNCWFCAYFSSEKSWWNHLKHPTHMQKVLNYYKDSRSTDATVLFCRDCSVLTYGSKLIETLHIQSFTHRRKSKNEIILGRAARIRSKNNSKNRLLSSGSSSRERGEGTTESFEEDSASKTNDRSGADKYRAFRSLSVSSNTSSTFENRQRKNSSDDEYIDCDHGNEKVRIENEADEDGSEEEEVDLNDNIYNMLLQNESDVETYKLMSEEELDESLLNELKKNMTSNTPMATIEQYNDNVSRYEGEHDVINERENEIIRRLIIIRGIPAQVLKNKRIMYSTLSTYGEIKRTFVKKNERDSLYLQVEVEPEAMVKRLRENIENLKVKLGITDNLTIEHGTRKYTDAETRTTLSADAELLFSNRHELNTAVNYLILRYDNESDSNVSRTKIKNLETVVKDLAFMLYGKSEIIKVHVFGSRVTGLATENSDVDIYLQIGNTFRGSIHNIPLLQQQLVVLFANTMRAYPQEFKNITSIPFARVPIVRFTHVATKHNCDLSFKSGLSTMNSILVRTYLELDDRVKYLICAVKLWSKLNDLADRNLFTTYAQIWMVLFFLMQADIAVIPTVLALRHMLPDDQKEFTVEGWNCSFPNVRNIVWRSTNTFNKEELLLKFFEFYSNVSLSNYVLCSLTGIKIEKKHFLKFYEHLPLIFRHYKLKLQNDRALLGIVQSDFKGLCIQDPFDHSHNLTKTINERKFNCFVQICQNTADILKKTSFVVR